MSTKTDNAFATYWSESYFPALDGLRAICIALVMFEHLPVKPLSIIRGAIGVDIFFVLSGFLITTLLLREKEKYGSVSLKGFYVRRAFRIFPIYYLVLLFYFLAIVLTHDALRWQELKIALPYLLSFTQEFLPKAAGKVFSHSWSLGYEEKFYLVWPLLLLALYPIRRRGLAILLALGTGIMLLPWMASRSYGGLLAGALLGILLDRSSRSRLQPYFLKIHPGVALALIAVTYYLFVTRNLSILAFSAAMSLLVATLVLRQSMTRRLLENRVLVLLGKRSYAMYLVHVLVLNVLSAVARKAHMDAWFVLLPLAYLASFLAATVLFYLVEKPSMEFGRSISRRLRKNLTESLAISSPPAAPLISPIENPVDV